MQVAQQIAGVKRRHTRAASMIGLRPSNSIEGLDDIGEGVDDDVMDDYDVANAEDFDSEESCDV